MIIAGDALECLRLMPAEIAHCCVTSPPYYGLRDYGVAGQVGLEPTPESYVARMVEVFREVRRVLRNDGTLWLNIGDSYASGGGAVPGKRTNGIGQASAQDGLRRPFGSNISARAIGVKPKDLLGIPWMFAFALRADGWYLRQDIIWAKPNPMPESVTDRCTKAHEYLFMLTKSARYFYDAEAIKEPSAENSGWAKQRASSVNTWGYNNKPERIAATGQRIESSTLGQRGSRNKRSVWTVSTKSYKGAHFATFPPDLIEPCILAGTSARGVCPKCRAPWERITKTEGETTTAKAKRLGYSEKRGAGGKFVTNNLDYYAGGHGSNVRETTTIGWRPTCSCNAVAVPATVLDPFFGAGTTGLVAQQHGRDCIGIELNPAYALMAHRRIEAARPIKEAA